MSCNFYILCKYWRKHLRTAFALLFSGLLLTAIITTIFLFIREGINQEVESTYDCYGKYDLLLIVPDDLKNELVPADADCIHETVTVPGRVDFYGKEYTYGYTTEMGYKLLHIPMVSGSLPVSENEAAVAQSLLESVGYLGKSGDSITINGKQYILKGIIGEEYYSRARCEKTEYMPDDEISSEPLPLIYVGKPSDASATSYTIDLYEGEGVVTCNEYGYHGAFDTPADEFLAKMRERYPPEGDDSDFYHFQTNSHEEKFVHGQRLINANTFWLVIMSSICALIAVLSFICVLNIVFKERENTDRLLHNIGFSKSKSVIMYATEAVMFFIVQTVLGLALGILFYILIFSVRVEFMGMKPYSGFSTDPIVLGATADPLVIAVIFSAAIIALGYLVFMPVVLSSKKQKKRWFRCSGSAGSMISRALSSKGITLMQTVALSLIVFGTTLGYMRYTRDGKEYHNYLNYDFPPVYYAGLLDMEEYGIADYLYCNPIGAISLGALENRSLKIAEFSYSNGLSDKDTENFPDALSFGYIGNTFAVCDSETFAYNDNRKTRIQIDDSTKESVAAASDEQYKNFFGSDGIGDKYCYNIPIRLADEKALKALSSYISGGMPDISALNSGEQIILVRDYDRKVYREGDSIDIMSLSANDTGYGIGNVTEHTFKIGATLTLDGLSDKMLDYLLDFGFRDQENSGYFLITTAAGAASAGLPGAVYSNIYSSTDIDGGLVPTTAGMTRDNLSELKKQNFIDKFERLSGTAVTIVIMSLLGFAAYFSCIGLKIRIRSYEISVLRALGTPLSRIRRKLFISNLRIPVISTVIAGLAAYGVKLFTGMMYDKVVYLKESAQDDIAADIMNYCFLHDVPWMVPLIKPLVIIFIVISIITVILTLLSTKKFTSEISVQLNEERKRQ